jgi:hypothetical protein
MGLKPLYLLLVGLALLSLASPGYTFDYKTYPGSLCQPSSGIEAVDFIRGPGFIYNTNVQQPRFVTCPIIRDRVPHEGQTGERTQLDIGIWFNGSGITGQPAECRFYSLGANSSEIYVSPPQYTDTTQETQALYWLVSPEQTDTDGTYSINCQLPAYVYLLRYIAGEDNETDDGF